VKRLAPLTAATLYVCAAVAAGPQTLNEKLIDEYAACAAYYQIVSADLEKLGRSDSAANAHSASEAALRQATRAAQDEPSEQPADDRVQERFSFYIKAIARYMDHTAHNISVFAGPSGQRCKGAIEAPDAFRATVEAEFRGPAGDPPGTAAQ